ncbi:MAG: efflux RND transporter permease subunit, partial [Bacteroidales bacterium]
MLNRIIEFSLKNKYFVLITTAIFSLLGIYSMATLPVDAVPDITNNQVQIVTVSPNLSPQEVEKLITFPIEISMSNILNVTEIRSVSRYGLSVVTVVFKDDVPTLDTRQLVNEQLQTVMGDIPENLGKPELMPITTGLGEIFQYTLEVEPGYEDKYDAMELRTIQDWIVKRNLSGIPGVVEISSFGGYLKQYEVAVDPNLMRSLNVTISEVYEALSLNNQNSGGSYIEKYNNAYYIRSEGMIQDLNDIAQVVVANRNGVPITINDLGKVRYSSAKRFGAMTKNGKGECVGGITLMLKGANANQVMGEIQKRVEKVNTMLPKGIHIRSYLDRSALVNRNISTVIKNLIEGAIIVFLVLMFFLGNIRAGLIVASTIPLAMLFSFILMRIFGVSANLMSLGAIDFGIIIDGSIVIVEGILTHLHLRFAGKKLTQEEMSVAVYKSSKEIAKSAAFAVLIILIVFFPILTLTGIEGKTFKPMAQVLIFAIIGALILSMTYIPLMCSLFLNKKVHAGENFSDKMI